MERKLKPILAYFFVVACHHLYYFKWFSQSFSNILHEHGINMRHLVRIAACATLPHVRITAIVEMLARTAKVELNRSLRILATRWKSESFLIFLHK